MSSHQSAVDASRNGAANGFIRTSVPQLHLETWASARSHQGSPRALRRWVILACMFGGCASGHWLAQADPLPTTFTCLFCNHEKSISVKLDRKAGVGQLDCRVCGQKFQCAVNCSSKMSHSRSTRLRADSLYDLDLSAAVDVYGEWVDAAGMYQKGTTALWAFDFFAPSPCTV